MEALTFILAVVAFALALSRQRQIKDLTERLAKLESATGAYRPEAPSWAKTPWAENARPAGKAPAEASRTAEPPAKVATPLDATFSAPAENAAAPLAPTPGADHQSEPPPPRPKRPQISFERLIGVHLPVWGGAAMLLIGSFFLVRMAASSGFFTPTLGMLACAGAGLAMLAAAFVVRQFRIANHGQIGAALASAAIGTFYATAFMASVLFELTSVETGFVFAVGTAIVSFGVAMVFGRPVLIVGLLGAYLAPLLLIIDGSDDLSLHLYLAALLVTATLICARKSWWPLLTPVLILHGLWLGVVVLFAVAFESRTIPTAILLVFSPAFIWAAGIVTSRAAASSAPLGLILTIALALATLGAAALEFPLSFLLAFGALLLLCAAVSVSHTQRPVAPVLLAALSWLCLVFFWREPEGTMRIAMALFAVAAIGAPLVWHLLQGRSATRASLLLCATLSLTTVSTMVDLDGWAGMRDLPALWAAVAILLALASAGAARLFWNPAPEMARHRVGATFAAAATGFLSLAVVAAVSPDYFALVAALQVLGIALVQRRFPVLDLSRLIGAYGLLYSVLLSISFFAGTAIYPDHAIAAYLPQTAPWNAEIAALLLPALAFLAAATVLSGPGKSRLAMPLDGAAVALLAATATLFIVPSPQMLDSIDTPYWSSVWLVPLIALGLAALWAGQRLNRLGLVLSGAGLAGLTIGAAVLFVGLPPYQLWPVWNVPGAAIFNMSITGLMLPGVLALALAWLLRAETREQVRYLRWAAVFAGGFLVITGLLVDIRHLFHPDLLQGASGPIERYSYSGGLLLLAFAALAAGTRFNSQPLRLGSLAIMLVTVAKVFLFDVGGLEGLWRVASFIAMGGALLFTSWVYARFVFPKVSETEPA